MRTTIGNTTSVCEIQEEKIDYASMDYVRFESLEDGSILSLSKFVGVYTTSAARPITASVEYRIMGGEWKSYAIDDQILAPKGMIIDFRNTSGKINNIEITTNNMDETYIWGAYSSSLRFINTGRFNVSGNVVAMLDYRNLDMALPEGAFYCLFTSSNVVDASKLVLPKTKLARFCFNYLFSNDDKLEVTPKLEMRENPYGAYNSMFASCKNLMQLNYFSDQILPIALPSMDDMIHLAVVYEKGLIGETDIKELLVKNATYSETYWNLVHLVPANKDGSYDKEKVRQIMELRNIWRRFRTPAWLKVN